MKRILVAGPDNGMEFGWFLMKWQAKIRHMALNFDKTYVITTPDRMFAYNDFAKPYTEMTKTFKQNMWRFDDAEVTYIHPTKGLCCDSIGDLFYKYGQNDNVGECIVVHKRNKGDGREWDRKTWHVFMKGLKKITDLQVFSIGTQIHGQADCLYRYDHGNAVKFLGGAKLCIGPSSGAMHLASLCGCPHIVWTDSRRWNLGGKKGTNRERYETEWNPFKTEAIVIDQYGWQPPVDMVLNEVKKFLERK